ncbi:MAG TPA: hypothetical protein VFM54_07965 [Micromonosporaceae bacterium]|nr:hypothetical protein [Micromonosporaceae bacterium]
MAGREWGWTSQGRQSAKLHEVDPAEVIDALFSPWQFDNEFGDLLFVCGRADSGRLVTVSCQRLAPEVSVYGIVAVRLANHAETEQWRRRFG